MGFRPAMSAEKEVSFESALEELETLLTKMESGDLSLEDSLRAYERGVELTRQCRKFLDDAKLRVTKLMPNGSETPLDDTSDGTNLGEDAPS